jgi:hypothetical protein
MTETKSATTGEKPKTIYELFAEVKREIGPVGKDGVNKSQHYNFRGIDAVVNAAAPHLDKAGVLTIPMLQTIEYGTVEVGEKHTAMGHVRVTVIYRFTGPAGDSFDALVPGEAMDSGDKATAKAMSVAYRIALLQALNLPTSDTDPDSQSYERSPRATAQSAGEAFDNATPARPRQGRQETDMSRWETSGEASVLNRPEHTEAPGAAVVSPDAEPDEEAQAIADEAHLARTVRGVSDCSKRAYDAGKLNAVIVSPEKGGKGQLDAYLKWRRTQVTAENKALDELYAAGKAAGIDDGTLDGRVKELVGVGIEAATVAQMKEATAKLASPQGAPAS